MKKLSNKFSYFNSPAFAICNYFAEFSLMLSHVQVKFPTHIYKIYWNIIDCPEQSITRMTVLFFFHIIFWSRLYGLLDRKYVFIIFFVIFIMHKIPLHPPRFAKRKKNCFSWLTVKLYWRVLLKTTKNVGKCMS